VSDGDVIASGITNSLVIARGDVKAKVVLKSTILCGGRADIKDSFIGSTAVSAKEITYQPYPEKTRDSTIEPYTTNALSWVTFFQPRQAGMEVELSEGGLRVQKVHVEKRFARAGLKEGDVVLAVGGTAPNSLASFRQVLRRQLARDEDFALRVRRAKDTIDIVVSCKE